MSRVESVVHPIEPVFDESSRVLVLGTMPSPASRRAGFYYAHPQNRFWKVLAALFDEPEPRGTDARAQFALRHHIALWDVLASCAIEGASDASIANPIPNDLERIARIASISTVFTTGRKAEELFKRYARKMIPEANFVPLPSTSGANARMNLDVLISAYQPLLQAVSPGGSGIREKKPAVSISMQEGQSEEE